METRSSIPFIDPCTLVIAGAVDALPQYRRSENVAPISLCGGTLTVAVEDPLNSS